MQEILDETRDQMQQVLNLISEEVVQVRAGRAQPALVEKIKVRAYETEMELRELASITAPDPMQLVISPWDKNIIKNIEKAILESESKLTPLVDNQILRIKVPALTTERREELIKEIWQKIESGKVMLRQVRQETKDKMEAQKGQPGISEDDIFHRLQDLQKVIDEFQKKLDDLGKKKEEELRKI